MIESDLDALVAGPFCRGFPLLFLFLPVPSWVWLSPETQNEPYTVHCISRRGYMYLLSLNAVSSSDGFIPSVEISHIVACESK